MRSDISFFAHGSLRDDIYRGKSGIQAVSDVFRIAPLGLGVHDDQPGYPIVKFYLSAKEIKHVFETLLLARDILGDSYFSYFSG